MKHEQDPICAPGRTQESFPSCPEFFDPPDPLFGAIMYPVWVINGFKCENIHFLLKKSQKITKNAKKYIKLEKNVIKIFWTFFGPILGQKRQILRKNMLRNATRVAE